MNKFIVSVILVSCFIAKSLADNTNTCRDDEIRFKLVNKYRYSAPLNLEKMNENEEWHVVRRNIEVGKEDSICVSNYDNARWIRVVLTNSRENVLCMHYVGVRSRCETQTMHVYDNKLCQIDCNQ